MATGRIRMLTLSRNLGAITPGSERSTPRANSPTPFMKGRMMPLTICSPFSGTQEHMAASRSSATKFLVRFLSFAIP